MRGPKGAADAVNARLAAAVEPALRVVERREGLAVGTLGMPRQIIALEPPKLPLDQLPAIITTPRGLVSSAYLPDGDSDGQDFECTYSVRVDVTLAARTAEHADEASKHWILAVREALLSSRGLLDPEGRTTLLPVWTETYHEVTEYESQWMASAWADWQVKLVETLERATVAEVAGFDVAAAATGWAGQPARAAPLQPPRRHPALD